MSVAGNSESEPKKTQSELEKRQSRRASIQFTLGNDWSGPENSDPKPICTLSEHVCTHSERETSKSERRNSKSSLGNSHSEFLHS